MPITRLQGPEEKRKGIFYQFDSDSEPLGIGGMGAVYRGSMIDANGEALQTVAVKCLHDTIPEYVVEKARREAAIRFEHDNLIEMKGFIDREEQSYLGDTIHHYYVISEILEGVTLDCVFKNTLSEEQKTRFTEAARLDDLFRQDRTRFAIEVMQQVLSGLVAMHDAGYIHRDIDPTNIMVTSGGKIKIIDLGIAKKIAALNDKDASLTSEGQFVGKPEYAAPELVRGTLFAQDHTTDIYAAGILLFQCITGHVPFGGDEFDILQKQLNSRLPLKEIRQKELRDIIAKATEKDSSKRFSSAISFRVALDHIAPPPPPPSKWKKVINACIGIAVVFSIAYGYFHRPTEPVDDYVAATRALQSGEDAKEIEESLTKLTELSEQKNADATYLLSRLYFHSKSGNDYCPDSIKLMRDHTNTKLEKNNALAHQLLKKAILQRRNHHWALYELGCDYWKAETRNEAVSRDVEKAERYLSDALKCAQSAGDSLCSLLAKELLAEIEGYKRHSYHENTTTKM